MSANYDVIFIFGVYGQFGSWIPDAWIPDAWFVMLTFSLTVICRLTKTKNRTKKSLTQLSYYCFE